MPCSFHDLNLPDSIVSTLDSIGFETATPIQSEAIPVLMDGRDIVGIAQTGTGKTAAFALPMLAQFSNMDELPTGVQALILAPTRELAVQTEKAIHGFARDIHGLKTVVVYGGSSYTPQLRALKEGAQIVVGTPGRIMDLMDKGALDISNIAFFVLDEADEMLKMGFAQDVEEIASHITSPHITALFSATMPKTIEKVASTHLNDPVRITITPPASTVETVEQQYAVVPYKYKSAALGRVISMSKSEATLVFVKTRSSVEEVTSDLNSVGIKAAALSGDVAQKDRERIVERLRAGHIKVLVATDVAARGLDVDKIGLVVNFDAPGDTNTYVHRIGRTGRAGRTGQALTFFTPKESSRLKQIEKATGASIEEIRVPTADEVISFKAISIMESTLESDVDFDFFRPIINQALDKSNLKPIDLASMLLARAVGDMRDPMPFESTLAKQRREEHLDSNRRFLYAEFEAGRSGSSKKSSKREKRSTSSGEGTKYRIEVGHKDRVRPSDIVGAIASEGNISGSSIGQIDILATFSLVEILIPLDNSTIRKVSNAKINGRALRIRPDSGPKNKSDRRDNRRDKGGKKDNRKKRHF